MQEAAPVGVLYVVAGPIGNLEDITLRALRVLGEVDIVLAEDTRVTRKLLSRYDIHTPLDAYHAHTPDARLAAYAASLAAGKSIALLSDAGTPGISDPGDRLVLAALSVGARVVPIPGPSAATAAVSVAAIPGGRFAFEGFPPRGRADRHEFFARLHAETRAVLLFESARRIKDTVAALADPDGDRRVLIAREMTKRFEEVFRGSLAAAEAWLAAAPPRGEYALVLYPPMGAERGALPLDLEADIRTAIADGRSPSAAAKQIAAATGRPRREVYAAMLRVTRPDGEAHGDR